MLFRSVVYILYKWTQFSTSFGFLGGLTTFSTFSIEVTQLLQQEKWGWALAEISLHVIGSLLMTLAGLATVLWLKQN